MILLKKYLTILVTYTYDVFQQAKNADSRKKLAYLQFRVLKFMHLSVH